MSTSPTQQISEEVTGFKHLLNILTKTRAKSSPQQRSLTEMVDAIERLGKGKKEQERVPIPTLANKSTTDNKTTATTSNPITTNKSESAALQVWDELFGEDEISKIIEQSNYIQVEVARLLEAGQMEKMTIGIMEEFRRKREVFSQLQGPE